MILLPKRKRVGGWKKDAKKAPRERLGEHGDGINGSSIQHPRRLSMPLRISLPFQGQGVKSDDGST